MSPEQLQDASNVGPQTDVYALGVILYRMLTARMPYEGNLLDLALRIREGRPAPLATYLADLPKGFDDAVMRALAPALHQRYVDVRSFAQRAVALLPAARARLQSGAARIAAESRSPTCRRRDRRVRCRARPQAKVAQYEPAPRISTPVKEASTFHPVATRPRAGGALALAAVVGRGGVHRRGRRDRRHHRLAVGQLRAQGRQRGRRAHGRAGDARAARSRRRPPSRRSPSPNRRRPRPPMEARRRPPPAGTISARRSLRIDPSLAAEPAPPPAQAVPDVSTRAGRADRAARQRPHHGHR